MIKFISIIICSVLLSGCFTSNLEQRNVSNNVRAKSVIAIVIQKIDKNTARVGYPASKDEYGYSKYEKTYYVKDNILRNYADDDEITGYKVEKILNKTFSYTTMGGYPRTLSCGQLIKK